MTALAITYAWPPLPVADPEQAAAQLADVLQAAWDRVEDEHQRVLLLAESGAKDRALARLRELQGAVEDYQDALDDITPQFIDSVTGQYAAGVAAGASQIGAPNRWTLFDQRAVANLAADTYADLLKRSQDANRTTAAFARAVRSTAAEFIPGGATGQTLLQAGRDWRQALERRYRISAVTYRDGSVRTIRDYTDMAVRTKGRVAYNSGALARYADNDVRYVEVYDGGGCGWESHDDGDQAHGSIRTLDQAAEFPVAHPRCRRGFGPRPDLRSERQARAASPISDTEPEALTFTSTRSSAADRANARRTAAAERRRTG